MMRSPVVLVMSALLVALMAACGPMRAHDGSGVSSDSPYKRHNEWGRFGRPDVGGARANDR